MNEQKPNDIVAGFMRARASSAPLLLPSQQLENLDLETAYVVQKAFVQACLKSETIAGFKAALTGAVAQEAFGMANPVTGVLYLSGARTNGTTVDRAEFRSLLLETEIGFRLGKTIAASLGSVSDLREHVSAAFPMIEFADPGFGEAKATGLDLVAANAASAAYLSGEVPAWENIDLNKVNVVFSCDGETLHDALASDVMGDQWQALLWLVNQIVAEGYALQPGHLLMTGSIGRLHPAKPGNYVADYGNFGQLTFAVV